MARFHLGSGFITFEDRLTPSSVAVELAAPSAPPQTREHILLARQVGVPATTDDGQQPVNIAATTQPRASWDLATLMKR